MLSRRASGRGGIRFTVERGAYLRYDMRFSAPRLHNYGDA